MEYGVQLNSRFCYLISFILFVGFYLVKFKKIKFKTILIICAFWIYITEIINICFFPISANYKDILNNIELLSHYDNLYNFDVNIDYFDQYMGIQHILNVIMMIPFGLFLPMIWTKHSFKLYFVACVFTPIGIEILQLIFTNIFHIIIRFFDINDIVNNIFGTIIGLLIYWTVYKLKTKYLAIKS